MRTLILTASILLLICIGGCEDPNPTFERVKLGSRTYELELAWTPRQIERGMMGRASIGPAEGMLFVFPDRRVRSFWMKDCLVPLDVLFLDEAGRVVKVHTMQPPGPGEAGRPPSYLSRWPTQYAIEAAGGTAAELGITEGDTVDLPLERLKQLGR